MSDKSAFTIFDLSASSLYYKIIGLKLKQLIDGKKINLIKSKLFLSNLSYYIVFIFLCF